MDRTKYKIINDMLFEKCRPPIEGHMTEWAILVHTSIMRKLKNTWHNFSRNADWKISEYTLQIGSKCYEMFLVGITMESQEIVYFLQRAVQNSQFSFAWEKKPTLFINGRSFNILEKFIRIHGLQGNITKIQNKPGITSNDETIKVVTFNKSAKTINIIQLYEDYLTTIDSSHQPVYYYLTDAFLWLQPCCRQHFEIPIPDDYYSVFPIILNHLRTLNYTSELNIFDLLSIRLALCNERNPGPSSLIKYDIDFMIKRELAKIVTNSHLDLDQYFIDKNYEQIDLLIGYLVYEFQHHFETVRTFKIFSFPVLSTIKIRSVVKLALERDVLKIIKQKSNINFDIDGTGYDRMSLSLFLDLVECHNVVKIRLDTNYRWLRDECNLNRCIANLDDIIHVELIGINIYNFIEEFISSLKTVTFQKTEFGGIKLYVHCDVHDYTIFDNLAGFAVRLYKNKIDSYILHGLHKCNLKSKFSVWDCTFENTRQNWALLNNLKNLDHLLMLEDEGTWQSLFEFVLEEMHKSNSKEFRFDHLRYQIISGDRNIYLGHLQFTLDELNTKLEIRDKRNNQIIDLYELKFVMQPDDKSEYDFYQ